jgi:hypothetical protein
MLYNAAGEYKDSVLKWTTIDGKEIALDRSEIKETVRASGAMYVSALVHISDRLESPLSSAHVVRFMMVPPSQSIYAGWDSDFASGRDKYSMRKPAASYIIVRMVSTGSVSKDRTRLHHATRCSERTSRPPS